MTEPRIADPWTGPPARGPVRGGLVLAAFRGVRFNPRRVSSLGSVTSPPYDVIDTDEEARLGTAEPHNIVRVILPREDGHGPTSRYRHAAETLARWVADGTLVTDAEPGLYVYEQQRPGLLQRGLLGGVGLHPPEDRVVLPHEDVLPGPVADRLALMQATEANLEPIFLVYDGGGPASQIVEETATSRPPLLEATTSDGMRHRLWPVRAAADLRAVAADLAPRQALIADGHHRYATYRKLQAALRARRGPGPWDFGLALLVDTQAHRPVVGAIHRAITHMPGDVLAQRARAHFAVTRIGGPETPLAGALERLAAAGRRAFVVAGRDGWHLLERPDPAWVDGVVAAGLSPRLRALDATLLAHGVLGDLAGVADDDRRVSYEHDAATAVRHALAADGAAVLLNPVDVAEVMAVANAGERMPRKSTSFGPKPRTGLVLRTFAAG